MAADPPTGVFAARSDFLDRWIQVGVVSGNVINVAFPTSRPTEAEVEAKAGHPVLERLLAYLDEGTRDDFADVEIALTGPTAYRPVYDAVRTIPYGSETTTVELASTIAQLAPEDDPEHVVTNALRANPVPVLVPDHRVTDGPGGLDPDIRDRLRTREGLATTD